MVSTTSRLAICAASSLLLASKCGDEGALSAPAADIGRWEALTRDQLEQLWQEAQASAGVLAVEPETAVVGSPAAKKKTWAVADGTLKFFSYGFEPIWFPADVVRRTVCGEDPRFSYFWHAFSGDESDLHPWLHGEKAFRDLLGDGGTALASAVNVAPCSEVFGGTGSESCLYGEVSATRAFDGWFCGGRGAACRGQLGTSHTSAPAVFAAPETLCMHGPFVLERVHGWRPEIHPAEIVWIGRPRPRGEWTIGLVPDTSERFDQAKDYEDRGARVPRTWKPWSSERPVEFWVAFSPQAGAATRFDLSRKLLGKTALAAQQVTLAPPAPGAFATLSPALDGVLVAAKTWASDAGTTHGFLVVRTTLRRRAGEAAVLRLRGRGEDEPALPPEIDGLPHVPAAPAPEAVAVGRVRMLGEVREQKAVVGTVSINTLVRFDPRRPTVPVDEAATDRLNEALKGEPSQRTTEFGKERPFRVEWELQAVRNNGERVRVVTARPAQLIGSVLADRVRVASFPGPATEAIRVKTDEAPLEAAAAVERKPVSLGQLVLSVPSGVMVTGTARVFYTGTKPLDLPEPALVLTLRYPSWRYAKDWDLVKDVLEELDSARAHRRLEALRREACEPAPPSDCETTLVASRVEDALKDPVARWEARRELARGNRPFARFVRLFARNLVWDGRVSNDERDTLKKLLKDAPLTPN